MSYKVFFLTFLVIVTGLAACAQLTKEQRIQDSVIGWDPKNKYDHYLKPEATSAYKQKLAYVNKMAEWVKKSYTPVGSLGEYTRYIGEYGYGLDLTTWNVGYDYLDEQKHFRPIPEENTPFYFGTNIVRGGFPIYFMNKKGESFFTMQPNGYAANSTVEKQRQGMDKSVSGNASKYLVWINDWVTIYLAPGNKLPWIAVTRGELLDKAAAALDGVMEDKRKDEHQRWQGNPKGEADAIAYAQKEIDKLRGDIAKLKERYKNSLNEPALVRNMQTDYHAFQYDSWDIFKAGPNTIYYPVYKFDAAMLEKMKSVQPLFISVAVPYENKVSGNALNELYTAMTQNLNYEYIYNYFFDSAKVKGVAYVPANADQLKARLDAYRKKNSADINAVADTRSWGANVHFQEDWSASAEGGDPLNWYFNQHDEHDQVMTLKGQPGKWLKLGYNNRTMPTLIKKPFPANFTLEYDLVTDDFSDRYGAGVEMYMSTNTAWPNGSEKGSKQSTSISISLGAGSDADRVAGNNFRGEARLTLYKIPEVNEEHFNKGAFGKYSLVQWTNKSNKIHVALQIKNNILRLSINNKEIISSKDLLLSYGGKCADCSVPSDLPFQYLYWRSNQSTAHCYIGNIKITRE